MSRRVMVWLVSMVAVVALGLLGCAPEAAPPAEEGTAPPAEEEEEEVTPAAPSAETFSFKIQDSFDAANPAHIYAEKICDAVTAMSGGRLEFKSFTGGSIVAATKEMDAIDTKAIDGTYTCTMYNLDKWPEAGLFSARPGGLTAEAAPVWFQYYGIDFINRMAEGYDVIAIPGICPQPPEVFALSKKDIKTVDDIKGLRMRTSGDGGEIMTRLGASVVFMPGGELYESMQRGVIDAFEYSSPSVNWAMSFQEIAEYQIFSATRAPSDPLVFYLNKSRWESLPADLQAIVLAAVQSVTREQQMWIDNDNIVATEKFRDFGCKMVHLPPDVERAVIDTANEFYAEKAMTGTPLYKEILESQVAFITASTQQSSLNTPAPSA
ncbi:MAG: TRAP transporter substrate-binding protein DctP [Dehalococcoidia bacterium]|nr:TRAP transporter substrate-binding protein DctP [Dehalococcoidia bacterium]